MSSQQKQKSKVQDQPQATELKEKEVKNVLPFEIESPEKISLYKHPLITLYYFGIILKENIILGLKVLLKYWYIVLLLTIIIIVPNVVQGPHTPYVNNIKEIGYFMIYWIVLGIASSIGLGTGLHTFVLYLGPWIAKVAMVANDCHMIPPMIPNKWSFQYFQDCPQNVTDPIGFWDILLFVQLESFLWGFGTAIGELPPYFVAKAAAMSAQKLEDFDEIQQDINKKDFISKVKALIYNNLQKYGFITVLLCASIPNPLFDLAGITCGHFGISFKTFFSATFIGKAIIKVHIQMLFVIFVFSKQYVESFLSLIEKNLPFLKNNLSLMLEKQKKMLHSQQVDGAKPIIQVLWDYFITGMIIFFLISIINSLVQGHLKDKQTELKEKKGKQH